MIALRKTVFLLLLLLAGPVSAATSDSTLSGSLSLSPNNRYFLKNGKPFFWLGDTAWALSMKLTKAEATEYLDDTAARGFNVIQIFNDAFWALDNSAKTALGSSLYKDKDPRKLNPEYWTHLAWVVDQAGSRGIHVLLCIGGPAILAEYQGAKSKDYYKLLDTNSKRYSYGRAVGHFLRKQNRNIIWCLGQDEPLAANPFISGWNAMAEGLADGVNGEIVDQFDGNANYASTLITYHGPNSVTLSPYGRSQSSIKDQPWLDIYATYAGNRLLHDTALKHSRLVPVRPAFEIETRYESSTEMYKDWPRWALQTSDVFGGSNDLIGGDETRAHIYQTFQAGHMGYTYGNDAIYPFNAGWRSALRAEGRLSMAHAAKFYKNIDWTKLRPDQSLINGSADSGLSRVAAAYTTDGQHITVYFPKGGVEKAIRYSRIEPSYTHIEARWYNPQTGIFSAKEIHDRTESQGLFKSPLRWAGGMLLLKGISTQTPPGTATSLSPEVVRDQ